MRMRFVCLVVVALMVVGFTPVAAQPVGSLTSDDGTAVVAPNPWGGATGENFESDGDLTTIFASDNQFAGNMFDLEAIGGPLTIESFDMNIVSTDPTETIQLYYREGGSVGFETDPGAWTFFGEDTGVVALGQDVPTPVDIPGLILEPGIVYGIYLHLETYAGTGDVVRYTNGGPTLYSNADLELTTNTGMPHPAFSGSFFPREWNGTVYYNFGAVPTAPWWGLVLLVAVLALGTLLMLRRTRRA